MMHHCHTVSHSCSDSVLSVFILTSCCLSSPAAASISEDTEESTIGEDSTGGESEMDSSRTGQTNQSECSEVVTAPAVKPFQRSNVVDLLTKASQPLKRAMVLTY